MAVLFALFFVQRFFCRGLFDNKIFYALALALPGRAGGFQSYAGYVYNPEWPYERMALLLLSIALSGRFEIWHNVFWSAPLSLLGGLPTDGDEHHAIDNTFLAVPMNKGVLGANLSCSGLSAAAVAAGKEASLDRGYLPDGADAVSLYGE